MKLSNIASWVKSHDTSNVHFLHVRYLTISAMRRSKEINGFYNIAKCDDKHLVYIVSISMFPEMLVSQNHHCQMCDENRCDRTIFGYTTLDESQLYSNDLKYHSHMRDNIKLPIDLVDIILTYCPSLLDAPVFDSNEKYDSIISLCYYYTRMEEWYGSGYHIEVTDNASDFIIPPTVCDEPLESFYILVTNCEYGGGNDYQIAMTDKWEVRNRKIVDISKRIRYLKKYVNVYLLHVKDDRLCSAWMQNQ